MSRGELTSLMVYDNADKITDPYIDLGKRMGDGRKVPVD
jgi:hypothetical protein